MQYATFCHLILICDCRQQILEQKTKFTLVTLFNLAAKGVGEDVLAL
jgi:hypothetical protein